MFYYSTNLFSSTYPLAEISVSTVPNYVLSAGKYSFLKLPDHTYIKRRKYTIRKHSFKTIKLYK